MRYEISGRCISFQYLDICIFMHLFFLGFLGGKSHRKREWDLLKTFAKVCFWMWLRILYRKLVELKSGLWRPKDFDDVLFAESWLCFHFCLQICFLLRRRFYLTAKRLLSCQCQFFACFMLHLSVGAIILYSCMCVCAAVLVNLFDSQNDVCMLYLWE